MVTQLNLPVLVGSSEGSGYPRNQYPVCKVVWGSTGLEVFQVPILEDEGGKGIETKCKGIVVKIGCGLLATGGGK